MPTKNSDKILRKIQSFIEKTFSKEEMEKTAREAKWLERIRKIHPRDFILSILDVLIGNSAIKYLTSLLDSFNERTKQTVKKKPFYNRLNTNSFPEFFKKLLFKIANETVYKSVDFKEKINRNKFKEVYILDSTTFKVGKSFETEGLKKYKYDVNMIRVHVTYSVFEESIVKAYIGCQKTSDRAAIPELKEFRNCLILADAGYPSIEFFHNCDKEKVSFICRIPAKWRLQLLENNQILSKYLKETSLTELDAICTFIADKKMRKYRIIARKTDKKWTFIVTNILDADEFSTDLIGDLYRTRWQIELFFKELKSFCNLHKFLSEKEPIIIGLIWASLCIAILYRYFCKKIKELYEKEISYQKMASSARTWLMEMLDIKNSSSFIGKCRKKLKLLSENMGRQNSKRDQQHGHSKLFGAFLENP